MHVQLKQALWWELQLVYQLWMVARHRTVMEKIGDDNEGGME